MVDIYRVLEIVSTASLAPGFFLNLLLIYLIKKYSRAELGNFKNLLIIFASYDIFLIILHALFDPVSSISGKSPESNVEKAIVLPGMFGIVLAFPYYGARLLTLFVFFSYMISYVILMLHLLYRYWVMQKPFYIQLFSSSKFAVILTTAVIIIYGIVLCLCLHVLTPEYSQATQMVKAEFRIKFGRSLDHGWVIAEFWPNGEYDYVAISGPIAVDLLGVSIVIFVVVLASRTYRHISTAFSLSPSARSAQIRLLTTVCVQTFIPMVCVTIPYFSNPTLPVFGINSSFIADSTGFLMASFPWLDPLAVIILMKPYRAGLRSIITRRTVEVTHTVSLSLNTNK